MSLLTQIAANLPVEWIANTAIDMAKRVIDEQVAGEVLDERAQKIVRSGYFEAKNWLREIVKQSETKIDDKGLETFLALCKDTANEGGFSLDLD